MKSGREKKNLGELLKSAREEAKLTLRDVEEKRGISNAYLSQLESNKIKKPSPVVLHKLSSLLQLQYSEVLKLAGYPVPEGQEALPPLYQRIGSTTKEEDDALVEFLDFLRSRRK